MMNKTTSIKGYHILADLWGCPPEKVNEASSLEEILIDTTHKVGFRVVGKSFHQFTPNGATGVVLLETSHISVHSWPEFNFVALDVYSCSGKLKAKKAIRHLVKVLNPEKAQIREVERFR
ncbi:MAG: adenosylmethionine decarboxylase [Chloroflexota bacterium]|nr:MAG: adenosylmethionine decarboxylase [Chloroflexota bacterium]